MIPDDGHDTDIDFDEAITPNTSLTLSSASVSTLPSTPGKRHQKRRDENGSPLAREQMEAAMTLLVFKDS